MIFCQNRFFTDNRRRTKNIVLFALLLATTPLASAHSGEDWHAEYIAPYPLLHAAHHGDVQEINRLLNNGADVSQPNKNGGTALMSAAVKGHAEVVKVLLSQGADVNQANKSGWTALISATYRGHAKMVKMLLNHGADVSQAEGDGWTALMYAAYRDHAKVVKVLLNHGADANQPDKFGAALMYAAEDGHAEIVKMLLNHGADKFGFTDLTEAALYGHDEVVKMLLDKGADANQLNARGRTALSLAAAAGHSQVVKILLNNGADANQPNNRGRTALILAASGGHAEVVKALLNHGADVNQPGDHLSRTALIRAIASGHAEIVKILLNHGADANQPKHDYTALSTAVAVGHAEVVKILLNHGVDANQANKDGRTALMLATGLGHAEVVEVLLNHGADANQPDENGYTALLDAMSNSQIEIAKLLLRHGANPNTKAPWGSNMWDYVKDNKSTEYLLRKAIQEGATRSSSGVARPDNAAQVFSHAWPSIVVIKDGQGQGSGVIIRPNLVATNCHVISGGNIVIYKHDNHRATTDTKFYATVRHRDENKDFCLLAVPGLNGIPVRMRRYNTLNIGETVYALGSPKGWDLSISSGLISQLRQGDNNRWIQTDAAFSPGSSGGGLFDANANLIGIITRKLIDESAEGIGFAIPADLAMDW